MTSKREEEVEKGSLSEKIVFDGLNPKKAKDWKKEDYAVIRRRDVKQKIQNAQNRIKNVTKNEEPHKGDHNHLIEEIDKIFKEEFGDKLI